MSCHCRRHIKYDGNKSGKITEPTKLKKINTLNGNAHEFIIAQQLCCVRYPTSSSYFYMFHAKDDLNICLWEIIPVFQVNMGLKHIAHTLLDAKANPSASSHGTYPLQDPLLHGQMHIALLLLQAKAEIAPVKANGVLLALENGRADIARYGRLRQRRRSRRQPRRRGHIHHK